MRKTITLKTTVGLDVSEKTIELCEITPDGEVAETSRFVNSAERVRAVLGGREHRRVVLEAGCHSRWLTELLEELGHEVLVADPRKLKLITESFYKDDKRDAETLAMVGLELPHRLATVPLREEDHQRALTLVRGRATTVESRTKLMNAVRGLLKPYGIRVPKGGTPASFPQRVREVVRADLAGEVEPMLAVIEVLNASIAAYDRQVEQRLLEVAPGAVHLTRIHGVAALTTLYFVALIGDPNRFQKPRAVGAYLGLCRRRDDSGDYESELRITKAGDRYMRVLLVNCASHILGPFGKDSDLRRWGLRRVGGGSRAEKKKAKVAVARKLAVLMLSLWKSGEEYDPLRNSRTAAGTPLESMAA